MPQRIQRKRVKGWRMPDGAVYVGRPGIWGNPFWHVQKFHGVERSLALYRDMVRGVWMPPQDWPDSYVSSVYQDRDEWLKHFRTHFQKTSPFNAACSWLSGKDLACWCPLDRSCHADVLLEIANS